MGVPDSLVLASGNPGKLRELAELLAPLGCNVRAQSEWDTPEAIENAPGFVENALLKARNAARYTGLPALADDSGLVVPSLGGAPGVRSARFAGEDASDDDNNRKLLAELSGRTGHERKAYFHCTVVLVMSADDPVPLIASANWWGRVLNEPRGSGGFGYDPLFFVAETNCTSAELAPADKNRLSHRGQALRVLMQELERYAARRA